MKGNEQTNMIVRIAIKNTPVRFAEPFTLPKKLGLSVKIHSA